LSCNRSSRRLWPFGRRRNSEVSCMQASRFSGLTKSAATFTCSESNA
jgi:hypothetical protein